ncbi:hypothetical protein GQ43DRAFT_96486 [Delitschia confertaspora ATCC 74209]|uniref:BTB domain-containing protein n=1 Tax=Delitschia confertaspora ATCC 74209 TaxID=1513339 RepID=A0A9P4MNX6_9PLEO|nr:hypothetical protein GQ43DRAFT_96486 [Delitschia confertaspora ATCC 74209]
MRILFFPFIFLYLSSVWAISVKSRIYLSRVITYDSPFGLLSLSFSFISLLSSNAASFHYTICVILSFYFQSFLYTGLSGERSSHSVFFCHKYYVLSFISTNPALSPFTARTGYGEAMIDVWMPLFTHICGMLEWKNSILLNTNSDRLLRFRQFASSATQLRRFFAKELYQRRKEIYTYTIPIMENPIATHIIPYPHPVELGISTPPQLPHEVAPPPEPVLKTTTVRRKPLPDGKTNPPTTTTDPFSPETVLGNTAGSYGSQRIDSLRTTSFVRASMPRKPLLKKNINTCIHPHPLCPPPEITTATGNLENSSGLFSGQDSPLPEPPSQWDSGINAALHHLQPPLRIPTILQYPGGSQPLLKTVLHRATLERHDLAQKEVIPEIESMAMPASLQISQPASLVQPSDQFLTPPTSHVNPTKPSIARFTVGPTSQFSFSRKEFHILSTTAQRSTYLASLMNRNIEIELPEEDPRAFEWYVLWLKAGHIPYNTLGEFVRRGEKKATWRSAKLLGLVESWYLGDRFGDREFQDCVKDVLTEGVDYEDDEARSDDVRRIFEGSTAGTTEVAWMKEVESVGGEKGKKLLRELWSSPRDFLIWLTMRLLFSKEVTGK